jgi:hypothetical protein
MPDDERFLSPDSDWASRRGEDRTEMTRRPKHMIAIRKVISSQPIRPAENEAAECVLARLIALAYAYDHPELFVPSVRVEDRRDVDSARQLLRGSDITL